MLEHRAIPIRTKVILDADPGAASKTYPFTSRADLERQIVEDGDATAAPRSARALSRSVGLDSVEDTPAISPCSADQKLHECSSDTALATVSMSNRVAGAQCFV